MTRFVNRQLIDGQIYLRIDRSSLMMDRQMMDGQIQSDDGQIDDRWIENRQIQSDDGQIDDGWIDLFEDRLIQFDDGYKYIILYMYIKHFQQSSLLRKVCYCGVRERPNHTGMSMFRTFMLGEFYNRNTTSVDEVNLNV